MTFETRFTWEKLTMELRLLRDEDFGSLAAISIAINSVLWPSENVESCFRHIQFLGFELLKDTEPLAEAERWETLRRFFFDDKRFTISAARVQDVNEADVLMKTVLSERAGHPLLLVFLLLNFTHLLDLPVALLQAKHHYLLKWVRSGKTIYLDVFNQGRALNDQQLIGVINRTSSNLEIYSAKDLVHQYLDLLAVAFGQSANLPQLHIVYNLMLQMDDTNVTVLGQRALLRQRLGFKREARADLKRYFAFVDRAQAPADIRHAWMELENLDEPPPRGPTDVLH